MGIIISSLGPEQERLSVELLSSYILNPRGVGFSLRAEPKSGRAWTRPDPGWSWARTRHGPT